MSPAGLVEPFLRLIRGKRLEAASMDEGGLKTPTVVHKGGSRTMVVLAGSGAGLNLFLTFCVS